MATLARRASAARSGWRAVSGATSQLLPRRLFAGSAPRFGRLSSGGAPLPRGLLQARAGGAHLRRLSAVPDATAEAQAGSAAGSPSAEDSADAADASATPADAAPPVSGEPAAKPASAVGGSGAAEAGAGKGPARSAQWFKQEMERALYAGEHSKVVLLFEDMVSAGIPPGLQPFNQFVEAVATSRSVADARLAVSALTAKHPALKPDASTYTALLKGCESAQDKPQAVALIGEMQSAGLAPDHGCYHALIATLAAVREYKEAEAVLSAMRKAGVQPTATSYFKLINGAFRHDEADVAFAALSRMIEEWRTPNLRAYEKMLDHFSRLQHLPGQMRCLEGMMELQTTRNVDQQLGFMLRNELEGTSPDPSRVVALWSLADARDASLHWRQTTGVMHAFVQLERHLDAFRVATRHAAAGSKVTERLCEVIATGLACDPSLVDEAYFLLEGLHGKGKPVPLQAANLIIEACARIPDLDRAFATWAELSKLSLTPDIGTYNALLSTCVKARELSSARRLLHRLETEGVAQDAKTYAQRVVMHVLSNEPQQAMAVYRQCVDAELKPPVATYHTLINMLLRRKPTPNVAAAEELLTAMKAQHGRGHAGLERNVADAAEAVNKGEKYKLPLSRSQEMQRQKREERQAAAGAGAAPVAGK